VRYRAEASHLHAGSFLRERRISFHPALRNEPFEFARIFVHEIFHFVWLRFGNQRRWSYESLVRAELRDGVAGELGWSSERRKDALKPRDARRRTRAWRLYVCESFCDTAAWLYSGVRTHAEFTLPRPARFRRRRWFTQFVETGSLPV
jgi:hypothetical protein